MDLDPAIFVIHLQNASKKQITKKVVLLITFSKIKSKKKSQNSTGNNQDFLTIFA
jgi:hypothetical protein